MYCYISTGNIELRESLQVEHFFSCLLRDYGTTPMNWIKCCFRDEVLQKFVPIYFCGVVLLVLFHMNIASLPLHNSFTATRYPS